MSKDYTNTFGRVAPGSANPEVATNDALVKAENAATEIAQAVEDSGGLPSGGMQGQFLKLIAGATGATGPIPAWGDIPAELPLDGSAGQVLTRTMQGVAWADPPGGGSGAGPTGPTGPTGATGATGSAGGGGGGVGSAAYNERYAPPVSADFPVIVNSAGVPVVSNDPDVGITLTLPSIAGDKASGILKALPSTGNWSVIAHIVANDFNANYHAEGFMITGPSCDSYVIFGYDLPINDVAININKYKKDGSGFNGVYASFANFIGMDWFKIKYDDTAKVYSFYVSKDAKNWAFVGSADYSYFGGTAASQIGLGFGCNYQRTGYNYCLSVPFWYQDF